MVDVRIPPGARNGSRLRVPGKGNAGTMGAPPAISTSPPRWKSIPSSTARATTSKSRCRWPCGKPALGAKIEVPTIDGRTLLKIPQGTQNGQKFRLREKGVFNSRTNQRGDQIVEVAIEAPDPRDERTANCCASWPGCIPKIRAPSCGPKEV
jgi:molecular chaperone DnaJ